MPNFGRAVRLVRAVRYWRRSLWLGRQLQTHPTFGYRQIEKTGPITVRLHNEGYYIGCTITSQDGSTEDFEALHPLETARRQVENRLLAEGGWTMITDWKVTGRDADSGDTGMWARFAPIKDR